MHSRHIEPGVRILNRRITVPTTESYLMRPIRLAFLIATGLGSIGTSRPIIAQTSRVTMSDFSAGSDYEQYLRAAQIGGIAPLYPWSIRSFSRREIERLVTADTTGPWKLGSRFSKSEFALGSLDLGGVFNSSYPYGANDGPLWAGRGLTVAASGSVSGFFGPFSFALAPMAFTTTNSSFELLPNGQTGAARYNHGTYPTSIDLPQRFGAGSYSQGDPGNSYFRFDTRWIAAGISTANEWIGPATEFPFLLGNNAPGIAHLFLGSGNPWNIGIGHLHARVMWGKLFQSDFSPVTGGERYISSTVTGTIRLMASGEAVFVPRGIAGLELGVARFFHIPYGEDQPNSSFWTKPFRIFFYRNELAQGDVTASDNQLASIFFRWAFPRAGLEIYGERGYEDQFYDFREFVENLDHDREYMLGFQKILRKREASFDVLRAELVNYQISTLRYTRPNEGFVYVHSRLRQGHTNRGQLLGAYPGAGNAAGSVLAWSRYSPHAQTTFSMRRIVRDQIGEFDKTGIVTENVSDVIVALGAERTQYGTYMDFGGRIQVMDDLNRNFSSDVGNLNLQLSLRLHQK